MAKKGSEARRKKRLEKHRARREEKAAKRQAATRAPVAEATLPLEDALISSDWDEKRVAALVISRRHTNRNVSFAQFVVDLDGFGLKDFGGRENAPWDTYDRWLDRSRYRRVPEGFVSRMVREGIAWANAYGFPLPKGNRRLLDLLAPSDDSGPSFSFGRDGEPFLRGDEADIRWRVAQSGRSLEEFECELFPSPSKRAVRTHFVPPEYIDRAGRGDPLVRLEKMASLAERWEADKEPARAEAIFKGMEPIASQVGRLADYLREYASFLLRHERGEEALAMLARRTEAVADPVEKAEAAMDRADLQRYLGDAIEAEKAYKTLLESGPRPDLVRLRYARFLRGTDRREEARDLCRQVIAGEPGEDPEALEVLRAAYQDLYDDLVALDEGKEAKALAKEAKRRGIRVH
ncbi:MAG: hypothetical protein JXP34_14690 [Planctomycetes bacterium]|nr:hypothetical protein [Planctomycetota bacterium]